ncbi:conserved hypothetical protein [delta proteobacterium NaphS2]|nr:conserved hypothetical protein [delta proteobacterium NaphS2]
MANRASKAWQESWEIKSEYYFSILDQCNKNQTFPGLWGSQNTNRKYYQKQRFISGN